MLKPARLRFATVVAVAELGYVAGDVFRAAVLRPFFIPGLKDQRVALTKPGIYVKTDAFQYVSFEVNLTLGSKMKVDVAIAVGIALLFLVVGFWPRLPSFESLKSEPAALVKMEMQYEGTVFTFLTESNVEVYCTSPRRGSECSLRQLKEGISVCKVWHNQKQIFQAECGGELLFSYQRSYYRPRIIGLFAATLFLLLAVFWARPRAT